MRRLIAVGAFANSGRAIIAVNHRGVVSFCNSAASKLFGVPIDEALGQFCWHVAKLQTITGELFCRRNCPVIVQAIAGEKDLIHCIRPRSRGAEVMPAFDLLSLVAAQHKRCRPEILHIMTPEVGSGPPFREAAPKRRGPSPELFRRLSRREMEILQMMAAGGSTATIAESLFISRATVRNHVQHLLHKLDLHHRLDAVIALLDQHR